MVDLGKLATAHHNLLQVFSVVGLEVERAAVLVRIAVGSAIDKTAAALNPREADLLVATVAPAGARTIHDTVRHCIGLRPRASCKQVLRTYRVRVFWGVVVTTSIAAVSTAGVATSAFGTSTGTLAVATTGVEGVTEMDAGAGASTLARMLPAASLKHLEHM